MYKVGIIGTSFSSKVYIPVLRRRKNFVITGVCDNGSGSAKEIIKKFNLDCEYFKTAEDIICSKNNDLVCIVSPPKTHHNFIKLAIRQKKHFICEKPLGLEKFSYEKFNKKDFLNIINYHFRFERFILFLKKEIKKKKIGEIKKIKILWRFRPLEINNFDWKLDKKLGGGVENEILPHVLDYLYFLIEEEFKSIEVIKDIKTKQKKFLNEILNLRLYSSRKCLIEILIARNPRFKGSHKIFIKGSKLSALIFFKSPFDTYSKYLKIFRKNSKSYEILEKNNGFFFEGDDRKNSFNVMLDYIEKDKRHKFLPNIDSSNLVWKHLGKIER